MNAKQYSFTEFSRKTVINVTDGRELGHVCDLIFNNCGGIMALVVPAKKSLFKSLTSSENIFIPWNRIVKIGSDVILTDIVGNMASVAAEGSSQKRCDQPYVTDNYAQATAQNQNQYPPRAEQYPPKFDSLGEQYPPRQDVAPPDQSSPSAQTFYHPN